MQTHPHPLVPTPPARGSVLSLPGGCGRAHPMGVFGGRPWISGEGDLDAGAPPWRVRALRAGHAGDRARLARFFRGLSPAMRRWRFHGAIGELPAAWIDHLARPDPHTEAALLAEACVGGTLVPVGEARFVAQGAPPGTRELAVAVADGWQGRGVGLALMHALERAAWRLQVRQLFGDVQRDNLAMLGLAERAGFQARRHPTDPTLVRIGKAPDAGPMTTPFQL